LGYILGDFFTNSSGHPDCGDCFFWLFLQPEFVFFCFCFCPLLLVSAKTHGEVLARQEIALISHEWQRIHHFLRIIPVRDCFLVDYVVPGVDAMKPFWPKLMDKA
jgi:hypothetical protein